MYSQAFYHGRRTADAGKSNYVIGTYTGNGESPRTIDVGFGCGVWNHFALEEANFNAAACFSRCNREFMQHSSLSRDA